MEVALGRVVDGKVVVEGTPLEEGAMVTILLHGEEGFTPTKEQEQALLESIAQADRGETVDGWNLLRDLRSSR